MVATLADKISQFIPKAITRVRQLTLELGDEFDYQIYQNDISKELLLKVSKANDFIKLLSSSSNYGGLTERQVSDLIDFFIIWLELNTVIAANYVNYEMPIAGNIVIVSPGNYATNADLAAEIAARIAADQALSDRITALENAPPSGGNLPAGFFANYNTTYAVVFDDDVRLHTHNNKAALDQITTGDITNIKALASHFASIGEPGGQHVSLDDRARWNAAAEGGGGGGASTSIKTQTFIADGSTSVFEVTGGQIDQINFVAVNGNIQTQGTHYGVTGNEVDFTTNIASGWRVTISYFEGLSVGTGGGDDVYDLTSPTTIPVGGLPANSNISGMKLKAIIEKMVADFVVPYFSAFSSSDLPLIVEVGTALSGNKTFTWTIQNPLNIQPSSISIRDVTANTVLSSGLPDTGSAIVDIGVITNTVPITRQWRAEAVDAEGTPFQSTVRSLSSIYPYFYGKVASGGAVPGGSRPAANQALIDGGTKVVASSSGTITVDFNTTSDDYPWFATPSGSATKTKWWIDAVNNGDIGGAITPGGNLFPDPVLVNITSPALPTPFWSTIQFKIYIANYQTAISLPMELRNS